MKLHSENRPCHADRCRATIAFLHGLGADEFDLLGLASYFGEDLKFVSARAPATYGPGYSWFDIGITGESSESMEVDCGQARESLRLLVEFITPLARPLVLVGFSQGAMMALGMWLEHGGMVDGVVAMSGGWIPCFEARHPSDSPILMTHGEFDQLVPMQFALESQEKLEQLGANVEFLRLPIDHGIDEEGLGCARRWLDAVLENL